jgi:endonuclease IV
MALKVYNKQPRDSLDYDIDFSEWLSDDDSIQSIEVIVEDGIELVADVIEGQMVKLWIRGGTDGTTYKFTVLASTINRIKEVDFLMVVTDY